MTIFYNISFPTFFVDCSISAMPTKFARGGKNSLNPAKNPRGEISLNAVKRNFSFRFPKRQKLPTLGKILLTSKNPSPLPKMVHQNGAKNLPKTRHFLVNQGNKLGLKILSVLL